MYRLNTSPTLESLQLLSAWSSRGRFLDVAVCGYRVPICPTVELPAAGWIPTRVRDIAFLPFYVCEFSIIVLVIGG